MGKSLKRRKGFTLVELVVVIAIVSLLAALAINGLTDFVQKAKDTKKITDFDTVYNSVNASLAKWKIEPSNGLGKKRNSGVNANVLSEECFEDEESRENFLQVFNSVMPSEFAVQSSNDIGEVENVSYDLHFGFVGDNPYITKDYVIITKPVEGDNDVWHTYAYGKYNSQTTEGILVMNQNFVAVDGQQPIELSDSNKISSFWLYNLVDGKLESSPASVHKNSIMLLNEAKVMNQQFTR